MSTFEKIDVGTARRVGVLCFGQTVGEAVAGDEDDDLSPLIQQTAASDLAADQQGVDANIAGTTYYNQLSSAPPSLDIASGGADSNNIGEADNFVASAANSGGVQAAGLGTVSAPVPEFPYTTDNGIEVVVVTAQRLDPVDQFIFGFGDGLVNRLSGIASSAENVFGYAMHNPVGFARSAVSFGVNTFERTVNSAETLAGELLTPGGRQMLLNEGVQTAQQIGNTISNAYNNGTLGSLAGDTLAAAVVAGVPALVAPEAEPELLAAEASEAGALRLGTAAAPEIAPLELEAAETASSPFNSPATISNGWPTGEPDMTNFKNETRVPPPLPGWMTKTEPLGADAPQNYIRVLGPIAGVAAAGAALGIYLADVYNNPGDNAAAPDLNDDFKPSPTPVPGPDYPILTNPR